MTHFEQVFVCVCEPNLYGGCSKTVTFLEKSKILNEIRGFCLKTKRTFLWKSSIFQQIFRMSSPSDWHVVSGQSDRGSKFCNSKNHLKIDTPKAGILSWPVSEGHTGRRSRLCKKKTSGKTSPPEGTTKCRPTPKEQKPPSVGWALCLLLEQSPISDFASPREKPSNRTILLIIQLPAAAPEAKIPLQIREVMNLQGKNAIPI